MPGRGRRPTADYGIFSGALLFCFLVQNWCRDPPKSQEMVRFPEKKQSGPRLHLNVHFFTCLCYEQP